MRKIVIALCLVTVCYQTVNANEISAVELIGDIYKTCVSQYSTRCIKPKALSWISQAVNQDTIKISEDLTIVRTGEDVFDTAETRTDAHPIVNLLDKVDSFLSSHALRVETPEILKTEEARSYIPKSLLKGGIADGLQVPLVEGNVAEGEFSILHALTHPSFHFILFYYFLYRSLIREESDDPIHTRIEVQNNSISAASFSFDRFENMEGNDLRFTFPCHDSSYGHLQVRQAKNRKL